MQDNVCKQKIIFFTSALDLDNPLLAHSWNWVIEICKNVQEVECYPIHLGTVPSILPNNLTIREIGGGNPYKRIRAIKRLLVIFFSTIRDRRANTQVIYHMIKEPGLVLSPLFYVARVKQVLWYSHWIGGLVLKFVCTFVDKICTPTSNSFPLKKIKKVIITGHGIDSNIFFYDKEKAKACNRVYSVGRVARVKRLENVIKVAGRVPKFKKLELIGPVFDLKYFHELQELALKNKIELVSYGAVPYSKIAKVFQESGIYFLGSPNTLDKAAVQAAMCGSLVISEDRVALESIGMTEIWAKHLQRNEIPSLVDQLKILLELDFTKFTQLQDYISIQSRLRHSTSNLIPQLLQTTF